MGREIKKRSTFSIDYIFVVSPSLTITSGMEISVDGIRDKMIKINGRNDNSPIYVFNDDIENLKKGLDDCLKWKKEQREKEKVILEKIEKINFGE